MTGEALKQADVSGSAICIGPCITAMLRLKPATYSATFGGADVGRGWGC